jgi:hypothetical protein
MFPIPRNSLSPHATVVFLINESTMTDLVGPILGIKDPVTGRAYEFALASERSVLFATDGKGGIIAVYRPNEVTVEVR